VRAYNRCGRMAWSAAPGGCDSVDDAAEDFLERHRLIVVVAYVNRMAARVDRVDRQRGREVARGHLDWPVADREQAVAALDRLAYLRLACLAAIDTKIVRERLVNDGLSCVDHGQRSLHLRSQLHELGHDAEPVRVRIHEDRW